MISKFFGALLFLLVTSQAMAVSLSYLHGSNFRSDQGYAKERDTYTVENFGLWELGTVFFYYDITDPFTGKKPGRSQFFGGTSATLSWSKLFGISFTNGFVKDVSFRGEFENGSGNGTFAFRNYFYGLQYDLAVPGFDFFSLNTVARDNPMAPGVGFQLGMFWQMSHEWSRWKRFKFTGFLATAPWDGNQNNPALDKHGRFLTSQPQFLYDLGNGLWGKPNRLEVGAEYGYFLNRFQAFHKDEKVIQSLVKMSY